MSAVVATVAESGSPRRLTGIEAGRGIAATLVVLYHVARHLDANFGAPLLKAIFQFGHAGVDFFFVISGFVILFVHYEDIGNPSRLTHYVGRRFTRLMPTYWVATTLALGLILGGTHPLPSPVELAWSASLLPSHHVMVVGVAWTLQYEVLFYTAFCVLIVNRTAGLIVLTVWLSVIALAALTALDASWLPPQFRGAFGVEFFLGMAVAWLLRVREVPHAHVVWVTGLVLFGAAALCEDLKILNGYADGARLAYGIPAALIVLGIAQADRQNRLRVPATLRRLGSASYSIYLFQIIFLGTAWQALLAAHLERRLPVVAEFLICVVFVVLGGVVMSAWVEYPLMRLCRRRSATIRL